MSLTGRQLNRTTLQRQLLLSRQPVTVPDALRRVMALQAQEPATPYVALANRIEGFDAATLDRAFEEGAVVKASLMRVTLHAVSHDDYPAFHAAMRPTLRASRLYDRRFKESGLTIAAVDAYESRLLEQSTRPRSGPQIVEALGTPFGDRARSAWWAYRTYANLHHAPTGGPWRFGPRPAFVTAPTTLAPERHENAVAGLVERYLRSFGPASVADIAQFTLLTREVARRALERLGTAVARVDGPAGVELYDATGLDVAPDGPAPPRLLPMWESTLLAYADRSRIIPATYRPHVIRRNGDVLPTLLVDGYVAGVWRPLDGRIEVTAFELLPRETWAALAAEASRMMALLQPRDPAAYGRYARWWRQMPAVEVRALGA